MGRDDADLDSSIDGTIAVDCDGTSFSGNPVTLFNAGMYTANNAHTRFSILASNELRVNETTPDSPNLADYVPVLGTPSGAIEMYSARIDPGGTVIYVSSDDGAAMTYSLGFVSRRNNGGWQAYESVSFRATGGTGTINLAIGATIGGSTDPALGPRRLPISYGGTSFDEFRELPALPLRGFEYLRTWTTTDLGVLAVRDPSFTPDGLRVVYIGQLGGDAGIYMSTRTSLSDTWGPPTLLRLGTMSDFTPYLTQDCQHLYWSENGTAKHAVHI